MSVQIVPRKSPPAVRSSCAHGLSQTTIGRLIEIRKRCTPLAQVPGENQRIRNIALLAQFSQRVTGYQDLERSCFCYRPCSFFAPWLRRYCTPGNPGRDASRRWPATTDARATSTRAHCQEPLRSSREAAAGESPVFLNSLLAPQWTRRSKGRFSAPSHLRILIGS